MKFPKYLRSSRRFWRICLLALGFVCFAAANGQNLGAAPAAVATAEAPAPGAANVSTAAQVLVPLSEYEKLQLKPSITVVDTLRLLGSFSNRDLALSIAGRSTGLFPKVDLLAVPPTVSLHSCEGDALLSKGRNGVFALVPLGTRFAMRCRIAIAGSDRLQLESMPSVLWIESQIADGELMSSAPPSDSGSGNRSVSVIRISGGNSEVQKPSAIARYRITLQPEATLFTYQIEVRNPNRSQQPFLVELKNGERVQNVDAAVSFEPAGTAYRFQLPPGEQTLTLTGTLPRSSFVPPVSASIHYLLLESHPLLRPNITTAAKPIGAQDVGLATNFRGARGFLLTDADKLGWQVLQLEALRTTSFAVSGMRHVYFLSGDGQALGESTFSLDNQGAPALSLPMHAEPSYASLQNEPVLLTRDETGHLWLPLGHGPQEVQVQHRQRVRHLGGFGYGTLFLPALAVPASSAYIELHYGKEWVPLYEEFAPELRLPFLEAGALLGFVLLVLWSERLLMLLGCGRRYRIGVAGLLSLGALTSSWWLALLCISNLVLSGIFLWPWLYRRRLGAWTVVGALFIGGVICLAGTTLLLSGRSAAPTADFGSVSERRQYGVEKSASPEKPKPEGEPGAAMQDLPARFVLPPGGERSYFHREMLLSSVESPRMVHILVMSRPVLGLCGSLLFCAALLLLLGRRRQLQRGLSECWLRLQKSS